MALDRLLRIFRRYRIENRDHVETLVRFLKDRHGNLREKKVKQGLLITTLTVGGNRLLLIQRLAEERENENPRYLIGSNQVDTIEDLKYKLRSLLGVDLEFRDFDDLLGKLRESVGTEEHKWGLAKVFRGKVLETPDGRVRIITGKLDNGEEVHVVEGLSNKELKDLGIRYRRIFRMPI